jgi:hypothetical protein
VRGRQLVWSDEKVQELTKNFVTVADEVWNIYPEGDYAIQQRKGDPAFEFFKAYGAQVPRDQWHEPGTKQGIYFIGPNGEYLEARFASSNAPDIIEKATRALERWEKLRAEKGYANKPVPRVETRLPEVELELHKMVLRVNLRDLPRNGGKVTKFDDGGRVDEMWLAFRKWAFNENWFGLSEVDALVTNQTDWTEVSPALFRRICRAVLVDNVRGQAPTWEESSIESARLNVRRTEVRGGKWVLEYRGNASMRKGGNSFAPRVYGQGVYDPQARKFESLDLVATGMREGAWQFNNRKDDLGPAPMGITLSLYR